MALKESWNFENTVITVYAEMYHLGSQMYSTSVIATSAFLYIVFI